jgi:hypothetical protein
MLQPCYSDECNSVKLIVVYQVKKLVIYETQTITTVTVLLFWVLAACRPTFRREEGDRIFLRNVGSTDDSERCQKAEHQYPHSNII